MAKGNTKYNFDQLVLASIKDTGRNFIPKIIWPLLDYATTGEFGLAKYKEIDSYTFPGTAAVCNNSQIYDEAAGLTIDRNNPAGISLGIREFWEAFYKSTDILFADSYFAPIHYCRMMLELEKGIKKLNCIKNKIITIFAENDINSLRACANEYKNKHPQIYANCSITIRYLPCDKLDVHDRFAIMDGEIWHCGAAVGGMHGSLNAVTRGWEDKNNSLRNFFINKGGNPIVFK